MIYRDDRDVLCRRWNWRECDRTKMRDNTRRVCLVVEGLPPVEKAQVESITRELAALISSRCRGPAKSTVLDVGQREAALEF